MQGAAVHIIGAELSEWRRPRRRRLRRLCPMRISPIAIGWCHRRHGIRPRYDERDRGQCEALVTVVARLRVMRFGGAHHQGEEDGACKSRRGVAPRRSNHGESYCRATSSERFSSRSCLSHLTTFASSCFSRPFSVTVTIVHCALHLGWSAWESSWETLEQSRYPSLGRK